MTLDMSRVLRIQRHSYEAMLLRRFYYTFCFHCPVPMHEVYLATMRQ